MRRRWAAVALLACAASVVWVGSAGLPMRARAPLPQFASAEEALLQTRAEALADGPCFSCGSESRALQMLDAVGALEGPYTLADLGADAEARCAALEPAPESPAEFPACPPESPLAVTLDAEGRVSAAPAEDVASVERFRLPQCTAAACKFETQVGADAPAWPAAAARAWDGEGRSAFAWAPLAGVRGLPRSPASRRPNIVLLVLDSVSRCHLGRHCPVLSAADALWRDAGIETVDFRHFHTIHYRNTLFQMTAALSGLRLHGTTMINSRMSPAFSDRVPRARWIWNFLRDRGYLTAALSGWMMGDWRTAAPTARNFEADWDVAMLGIDNTFSAARGEPACQDGAYPPQFRLQRLRELVRASEAPVFAWDHSFYAHDHARHDLAAVFDASYKDDLRALLLEPGEPTVVLLMGDHGPPESTLHNWPALSLMATPAALEAAGVPLAALRANADRLVSHYDLYATLRALGDPDGAARPPFDDDDTAAPDFEPAERGFAPRALWEPIPADRSIAAAGIPASHAAMDAPVRALPPGSKRAARIAEVALDAANWKIMFDLHCPRLDLARVVSAEVHVLGSIKTYVVAIETTAKGFEYSIESTWVSAGGGPGADVHVAFDMHAVSTYEPNRACTESKLEFCLCAYA